MDRQGSSAIERQYGMARQRRQLLCVSRFNTLLQYRRPGKVTRTIPAKGEFCRKTSYVPKTMSELPDDTHKQIEKLSADGDALAEAGRYPDALKKYWAAWDLLPEPKTDWDAATWLLAAIGDANFLVGDYHAGRDNLSNAMHCPGAIGNPFFHLRLGQCQLELGNEDGAADELTRAYMAEGPPNIRRSGPKISRVSEDQTRSTARRLGRRKEEALVETVVTPRHITWDATERRQGNTASASGR